MACDEQVKRRYDTSGNASAHGCFILYIEHIRAMQDIYAKGVLDGMNSAKSLSIHKNLDDLDKLLDKRKIWTSII